MLNNKCKTLLVCGGGEKIHKTLSCCQKKETICRLCSFFFFFLAYQLHNASHSSNLTSWSSNLLHRTLQGVEKRETTTGGMAMGQPDQDTYIIYSLPSLLLLKELFFSVLLLLLLPPLLLLSLQYVKTRSEKFASSQSPAIISLSSGVQ